MNQTVKKEKTIKEIMDSADYEVQKGIVFREINRYNYKINPKRFQKSPEEKEKLFNLKEEWKRIQRHNN